jgi:PadR family transcriptional regulator PadR
MAERVFRESERLMAVPEFERRIAAPSPSDAARVRRVLSERLGAAIPKSHLTAQEVDVLAAVLLTDSEESYGYELARLCGAPTGSMYKVLARLEQSGLVHSRDEDPDIAEAEGRPARRLYSLSSAGEAELARWRAAQLTRSPSARFLT